MFRHFILRDNDFRVCPVNYADDGSRTDFYNSCTFSNVAKKMWYKENDIPLAGAVHDFTCPQTGKKYMYFPIRKL